MGTSDLFPGAILYSFGNVCVPGSKSVPRSQIIVLGIPKSIEAWPIWRDRVWPSMAPHDDCFENRPMVRCLPQGVSRHYTVESRYYEFTHNSHYMLTSVSSYWTASEFSKLVSGESAAGTSFKMHMTKVHILKKLYKGYDAFCSTYFFINIFWKPGISQNRHYTAESRYHVELTKRFTLYVDIGVLTLRWSTPGFSKTASEHLRCNIQV